MARFANRNRVLAKLAALPPEVRAAIKVAIQQSADELQAAIKRQVPVDQGALRDSIAQTWGGGKVAYSTLAAGSKGGDPDLTVVISAGNSAVRYAHIIEFGTRSRKAQPFFFPVYRAFKRRIKGRITRATTKAARSAAAKG